MIELLAVIVIMGILMVVAIPAVTRTIENTRKDTYLNTAKQYISQVKTLWSADGLKCTNGGGSPEAVFSASAFDGTYYVQIKGGSTFLLEEGGNSPWKVKAAGWLKIVRASNVNTYSIYLEDTKGHVLAKEDGGQMDFVEEKSLSRSNNITLTGTLAPQKTYDVTANTAYPSKGGAAPTATDATTYICEEA